MLPFLFALLSQVQGPSPAAAPDKQIAMTGSLGVIVFALDRAAWAATDALTDKVSKDQLSGLGGWVVERGASQDSLIVTFYRGEGDAARAFFTADVRREKVRSSWLLPAETMLTPAQQRLARARSAALAESTARTYRPCTASPFNTVALPTSNPAAPIIVYLLTAQTASGTYPVGGHYRVVIAPDGKVAASRPFSRTCLNLTPPRGPNGEKPAGMFVNHILDPLPTEMHVFASLSAGLPLFVGAGGKVWMVDGRTITLSDMKSPAPPR